MTARLSYRKGSNRKINELMNYNNYLEDNYTGGELKIPSSSGSLYPSESEVNSWYQALDWTTKLTDGAMQKHARRLSMNIK